MNSGIECFYKARESCDRLTVDRRMFWSASHAKRLKKLNLRYFRAAFICALSAIAPLACDHDSMRSRSTVNFFSIEIPDAVSTDGLEYGLFRLTNGGDNSVIVNTTIEKRPGEFELANPQYDLLTDRGWIPIDIGYDYVPRVYRVDPGKSINLRVALWPALKGIVGFYYGRSGKAESLLSRKPITIRIREGLLISDPLEIPEGCIRRFESALRE